MLSQLKSNEFAIRCEQYGGIISSEEPPFLSHVDRDFMRELGADESPLWIGDENDDAPLSAPLEVHFSVTNRCRAGCDHCYTNATPNSKGELPYGEVCAVIDRLAEMNVFHLAFGGGEALEREDIFDIAAYARKRGIVPNLTTNGMYITKDTVERFTVFGQVNISVDSLKPAVTSLRKGSIERRLEALKLLRKQGIRCGINCVLTKHTYHELPEIIKAVKKLRLREIELLRLKPSGRAADPLYQKQRLSDIQHRELLPYLKQLYKKYKVHLKIDCSFVPMVVWHNPDKKMLERMSLYGCEAGNVLLGITPEGTVSGCSFLQGTGDAQELPNLLHFSSHILDCKNWIKSAPEPCNECAYLSLCKGGCRAVSAYVKRDFYAPDPECPRVIYYKEK